VCVRLIAVVDGTEITSIRYLEIVTMIDAHSRRAFARVVNAAFETKGAGAIEVAGAVQSMIDEAKSLLAAAERRHLPDANPADTASSAPSDQSPPVVTATAGSAPDECIDIILLTSASSAVDGVGAPADAVEEMDSSGNHAPISVRFQVRPEMNLSLSSAERR
jgi:hypothetical protein